MTMLGAPTRIKVLVSAVFVYRSSVVTERVLCIGGPIHTEEG